MPICTRNTGCTVPVELTDRDDVAADDLGLAKSRSVFLLPEGP